MSISRLLEEASAAAAQAHEDAARASEASATARGAAQEAAGYAQQARNSATEATTYRDKAGEYSAQADKSAQSADGSAQRAKEAAVAAKASAVAASKYASRAGASAAHARSSAADAYAAAASARQSALAAGKDSVQAAAAAAEAVLIQAAKKQAEDEARRKAEATTPPQPGTGGGTGSGTGGPLVTVTGYPRLLFQNRMGPMDVFWGWVGGQLPNDLYFFDGDYLMDEVKKLDHVKNVHKGLAYGDIINLPVGFQVQAPYSIGSYSQQQIKSLFWQDMTSLVGIPKVSNLWADDRSRTKVLLGSFTMNYRVIERDTKRGSSKVQFEITNATTAESGTRPPGSGGYSGSDSNSWAAGTLRSLGVHDVNQHFLWTEEIKWPSIEPGK